MDSPANLVHVVLEGGFPPATPGNPRPFGMPPFAQSLSDDEVAAVVTYIRTSWGNRGSAISARDANALRPAEMK
jgi:mono/diheme cytochrome c family protein